MHDWNGNECCARKNLIRRLPDRILIFMLEPFYPGYHVIILTTDCADNTDEKMITRT